MGTALVGPGHAMLMAPGRAALWRPLRGQMAVGGTSFNGPYPSAIAGLSGWWDAGTFDGMLDDSGRPLPAWNSTAASVADKSGSGNVLVAYRTGSGPLPKATPRLNGFLGGFGLNTISLPNAIPQPGSYLPQMDADLGFRLATAELGSGSGWTWYLVWSRPNWRQGVVGPITLLSAAGATILQADGVRGAGDRLMLFSGAAMTVLTASLERRHTHSIIIRNTPGAGIDVWLDGNQVASGAANPLPASAPGTLCVLHAGISQGGAQCWFHEAANWPRALASADIAILLACATRWQRGARKGVQILVVGQSNAGNGLKDGAWHLLAQGVAWHLGALAYGVIGLYLSGSGSAYTCMAGHGLYDVRQPPNTGTLVYLPGDFLHNPADGSDPASYGLGSDGNAVQTYLGQQIAEDLADIAAILWPWSETDSTRAYSEKAFYLNGTRNLLARLRGMLGRSAGSLPLIWWNAMPFWTDPGVQMVREVAAAMAADTTQNVIIGLPMTADVDMQSDNSHIVDADNIMLGQRAAPTAARSILAASGGDSFSAIPAGIPTVGGPKIVHAFKQDATHVVLAVQHDAGDDLLLNGTAPNGTGFVVMDGGSVASPGPLRHGAACARIDATHLLLTLDAALVTVSASCLLFYPYGSARIGHGNAVTDNASTKAKPAGWDVAGDLGSSWNLNFPLAATSTPIVLSDLSG